MKKHECQRRAKAPDGTWAVACGGIAIAYPVLEMRKNAHGGSFDIHVPLRLCQTHVDDSTVGMIMDNALYLRICQVMEGHGYEAPARDLTTVRYAPLSEMPVVIGGERELPPGVPIKRVNGT